MKYDFLNKELATDKCMACEISKGNYIPPGGIIFSNEYFFVHQDPYVAIPGFLIISPHRHIFSIEEMTPPEIKILGGVIAVTEKIVKEITGVKYITIVQEDKVSEGHLHIWVFPWHDFLVNNYEQSLTVLRTITERYKHDITWKEATMDILDRMTFAFKECDINNIELDFHEQIICDMDFQGQSLKNANFRGAVLKRCDFKGCDLSFANFDDADLYRVSFCNSIQYSTSYKNADLTRADFTDAHIYGIKIFGADLTHTIFDNVVKEEREKEYAKAEDIYNTIKRAYAENGNKEEAAKYYYKQCVARRKQQKGIRRFLNWAIADGLIGYGERLSHCLIASAITVIGFALCYFHMMDYLDFHKCLFSSLTVFFGFDSIINYNGPLNIGFIYAFEQLIGYFFIALALIGLTRKIVRD